jgi:dihydroorotate dehydrogenase electron transfer subunit
MKQGIFEIKENTPIAENTLRMRLSGDASEIARPGQFVNIQINGAFLRRPLSVCYASQDELTVIYRVAGKGTEKLASMLPGDRLDILTGLGNGFDLSLSGNHPLLIGGGTGVSPMYWLAKELISQGKSVKVILGFAKASEVFYEAEFQDLGAEVSVTTEDGSYGVRGYVTAAMADADYTYFYTCGPEAMLKAVCSAAPTSGQMSFSARMGCGFGACMGCTCKTIAGNKRICRDGPVMKKEEILWED